MQLTPEMKQQLEEQKKQCIFCKIVSNEIPGKTVFQDDLTQAVIDIYPAIKGHTVYFLQEHYPIMPYIPADEFKHYFGLVPQLTKAVKKGMVRTGANIFIANGGVAGQQAPHVLLHILPREEGDNFSNFAFDKRTESLAQDKIELLKHNFPIMMQNHFGRNPAEWHSGKGDVPAHLSEIYESNSVIYEDEKVLAIIPQTAVTQGQIEIYSKTEKSNVEQLSIQDSEHLFFVASFAATALFEGLGAQGTNIIVKSGQSDDNPEGRLVVYVLARNQEDGLQNIHWQPKQTNYDLDQVKDKIKDETWKVKYSESDSKNNQRSESNKINYNSENIMRISDKDLDEEENPEDEINAAIKDLH